MYSTRNGVLEIRVRQTARRNGGLEHPERWPRHYIEGGAKRGRPAANTDQTFKTAGMDFSMFCFDNHPPTHEELLEFEAKAEVSVFVYDWFSRTVDDETFELVILLRSPEKLYSQEVQILNYRSGDESHLMLVKDFQSLASLQHMRHKCLALRDTCHDHQCHRCMRRFADNTQLNTHIGKANCLKPHRASRSSGEEESTTAQ